ncbi:tyrosine-type recombinase/integrase [Caproicibacter fermentans]|uniref:Site-specific integrase n=1 Tax=Caproicibacter fermentans TaxID=2576756 RepID=A0A7G8T8A2_9FIRM|nr:site-specific integrase [Caproicibacter fermentans]QNK39843.1 site-specific integrase [Caproicibacter fermentans]
MVTGCLIERGGKYTAVLNLYIGGKRKQKSIATGLPVKGNKRRAEELLEQYKLEYSEPAGGKVRSGKSPLFADFMRDWLESTKRSIERTTYQSYKNMIDARIDKHFRDLGVTLAEVEPKHIEMLHEKIFKDGFTANTVIHYHAVIRKALQYAVKNGLIDHNPADRVDRPKLNRYLAGHYTREELMTLFDVVKNDPISVVILLAAYYGLRRSEVLGLRWSCIDFEQKTITINHKVTEGKEDGKTVLFTEDKLKTKSSFRTLPLIPAVEELLKAVRTRQEQYRKLFKKSYDVSYLDYICVDQMGVLFRPNYITDHFHWLLEHYQLRKIRFHDLRHSCASLLLAQGIPMKAIQEWLGHSTFATTADIYSHLDFSSKRESAEAISSAFSIEAKKPVSNGEPDE